MTNEDNRNRSITRRYMLYAAFLGVVMGMGSFGEVIARKSLGASELSVTFLTMAWPLAGFTSIWWARILVGRDQRRILLLFGSIAYLIFLTGGVVHTTAHLLVMYLLFFFCTAMFMPSGNRILQQHISLSSTGRFHGLAAGMRTGTAALFAAGAGWYMDHITGGFRHLYVVAALVGFAAVWQIASIPMARKEQEIPQPINRTLLLGPLRNVIQLLKERKDFLRFEIAFMTYGIGFMMIMPVVPLYLVDDLQLTYTNIGLARGTVPQLVMVLGTPLVGRLFDRYTPHRIATVVFSTFSFFPIMLIIAGKLDGISRLILIFASFGVFGIAMSGMAILWALSSLRFAGREPDNPVQDAGVYHSVHIAATSLRGMFAPLFGYIVMNSMGKITAFITSSTLLFIAGLMMIVMRKLDIRRRENRSLRV